MARDRILNFDIGGRERGNVSRSKRKEPKGGAQRFVAKCRLIYTVNRLKLQIVMAASRKVAESGDAEFVEDYFRFHLL